MKFNYPRVYQWALLLLLAAWMLFPGLTGLFCLLFLVIVITGIVKKELTFKFNRILLGITLFLPYYSLYAMNAIDPQEAMFGIEKKLSFVLFPIVFSFVPKFYLNKRFLENGFLISLFLMLFSIMKSTIMMLPTYSPPIFLECFITQLMRPFSAP